MTYLEAFEAQTGVHCESTMLRNMLAHAGIEISESMIFGIGEGIDFNYYRSPYPEAMMCTGRSEPSAIVRTACAALGVDLVEFEPADADAAQRDLEHLLEDGHVVGVTVDMFYLDYFDVQTHFSAHCISVHGIDDLNAHVADTDRGEQTLPTSSLRAARCSNEGYKPSPNRQFYICAAPSWSTDDLNDLLIEQSWLAIRSAAHRYLSDRGATVGHPGLRQAVAELPSWAASLSNPAVSVPGLGRFWRFAGTGGTNFRGLFADFLEEFHARSGDPALRSHAEDFRAIENQWKDAIDWLIGFEPTVDLSSHMDRAQQLLSDIADAEEVAFARLSILTAAKEGALS